MILLLENNVAFVPVETPTRSRFVIEFASAQGMTTSGRCYTPEELVHGGPKKDQAKRPISETEAEESWKRPH